MIFSTTLQLVMLCNTHPDGEWGSREGAARMKLDRIRAARDHEQVMVKLAHEKQMLEWMSPFGRRKPQTLWDKFKKNL